ncbi:MAG: hypothetical protein CM1200mP30_26000 [Pseudomonadota bacterium]|nr:MAG: hypothetical protein CM1200mP30_26000 [Pseudomonadota bacterium]
MAVEKQKFCIGGLQVAKQKHCRFLRMILQKRGDLERHALCRWWWDAANVTFKSRIVAGDPPTASQIKGPTIQEYDEEGVVAPYHIHAVAKAENWDSLLSSQVANHMKCDGFTKYCALL